MNKPCKRHRECCSYSCGVRKRCQRTDNCLPDGKPCKGTGTGKRPTSRERAPTGNTGPNSSPTECCSRNCANGKCEPKDDDCIESTIYPDAPPTGSNTNETCRRKSDCCSNYCSKSGTDRRSSGRGVCRNKDFARCNNTGTCTNRNAKTVCCSKICDNRKCKPTAQDCNGLTETCRQGAPRGDPEACCLGLECEGRKCVDPNQEDEETTENPDCLEKGKNCAGKRGDCCGGSSFCVENKCTKNRGDDDDEDDERCQNDNDCKKVPGKPNCRGGRCKADNDDEEDTTNPVCAGLGKSCRTNASGKRRCCPAFVCLRRKCANKPATQSPEDCSPRWGRCTTKSDCCGALQCKAQKCNKKDCKPKNRPCFSPTECCSNRCIKKGGSKKCGA